MMVFGDYNHGIPIQVRFSDIDRLNHVNNACYHNYAELGRVNYLNKVLTDQINWDIEGFILARTEIDHIMPIHLEDEVYCFTRISKIGNKSVEVRNSIVVKKQSELVECAAIKGILVAMNYIKNESIEVPDKWRKQITAFESRPEEK